MMLSNLKKLLTRRSDSEKALFISEKRYQDFVTSSRDWIWECDEKGLSTYSNQAVVDILGYTHEELIGQYTIKYMHEHVPRQHHVDQLA
jgi:PAS domain S-box-containing protein